MIDALAKASAVPRHVACVMDGNGRWATARGLERNEGHVAGEAALQRVVKGCLDHGVEWLTVYAFSTENWSRPASEVGFIMAMSIDVVRRRAAELREQGVRVVFSGRRGDPIPPETLAAMDEIEAATTKSQRLVLNVALNYGGRAEILDACAALMQDPPEVLDEQTFAAALYQPEAPDVDLFIRTSHELRVSNFLLWQIAYAELYFTERLWPDMDEAEFARALEAYAQRNRRFGGV